MGKYKPTDSIHICSKGRLPYYRPANILRMIIRHMENMGVNSDVLLEGSRLKRDDLDDPNVYVTPEQEIQVMRKIVARVSDPEFAFFLGQTYHIALYNSLGGAIATSSTFIEAVKILFQYMDLTMAYFRYDLEVKNKKAYFTLKELIDLKELKTFFLERETSAAYRLTCDALQHTVPLIEVRIAHDKPAHASCYGDFFKCPIHFNARAHTFIYDSEFLFKRLPLANSLMKKTYLNECEQLSSRLKLRKSVSDQVRHNIFFGSEGIPSLDRIARNLAVTPRTLRRRLTKEGTSFKTIVADFLKEKAINMIQTTSQPIEQIALELGYSNVPNFYRAFKSWTGHKPSEYRHNR